MTSRASPPMSEAGYSSKRSWWTCLAITGLIVLLDQFFKQVIVASMPYGSAYAVSSFFNLVHVGNTGVAFSFLADGNWRYSLSALGIGVAIVLAWLLWRGVESRVDTAAYTLVMGGALGNVYDRLARGFVVDYLDFHWLDWHWPAFNLADIAITSGAALLIIAAVRRPPHLAVHDCKESGSQRSAGAKNNMH